MYLEPDRALAKRTIEVLNGTRLSFDVSYFENEEVLLHEATEFNEYSLFVLNPKDPTDTTVMKHIRKHGGIAPMLLILEKETDPRLFQVIYYLSYNDILRKDFFPEEIVFHIYKMCHLWNNDISFVSKKSYFDAKSSMFVHEDEQIHLGKKETLLLKYLFLKSPCFTSSDEIGCYVYENEVVTPECIRALIRQLRVKIPVDIIESVKGSGYRICESAKNY